MLDFMSDTINSNNISRVRLQTSILAEIILNHISALSDDEQRALNFIKAQRPTEEEIRTMLKQEEEVKKLDGFFGRMFGVPPDAQSEGTP